ncbi:MAG TPA: methyltransferase domain-containing protein [Steroidobacteraceae bacterium]|nr:methyltransferase domain-containing protein [Steroidobacteraceae bacterium]
MNRLPPNSVRGQVRAWIEKHAAGLGDDVLEVGSRMHTPDAWWVVNRDLARGQWTGIDMQPGPNVDVVADLHDPPDEWIGRFSGVVLSEVLEHVRNPWTALVRLRALMQPGALLIVTVPFCFPRHAFPDDFYRFTESGLRAVLEVSGYKDVATANSGPNVAFALNDHGERGLIRRQEPLHTFAVARA